MIHIINPLVECLTLHIYEMTIVFVLSLGPFLEAVMYVSWLVSKLVSQLVNKLEQG